MPEFEEYLKTLRRSLDVDPRRADEIIAEVRAHLEERAAQFGALGMSPAQALEGALRSFGDPSRIASRLSGANRRYRPLTLLRAALALALVGGTMVMAVGLGDRWFGAMSKWLAHNTSLASTEPWSLLMILCMAPSAVIAGVIAGRRGWWIAGLPPFAWGALFWVVSLAEGQVVSHGSSRETISALVAFPVGGGTALAALGALGAHLAQKRRARQAALWVCGLCLAALAVPGFSLEPHDAVGLLATLSVVGACAGLLGLAALWGSGAARKHILPAAGLAWAACVAAVIIVACSFEYRQKVEAWALIAVGQVGIGLAFLRHYRASERKARRSAPFGSGAAVEDGAKSEAVKYNV